LQPKGEKVLANLGHTMCKVEMLAFLAAFLMAGVLWGYLENFLFWHLEDLGATKFLMGISLAIGTLAGVPLTMFSKLIIKTLGHKKIVVLAMLLYAIRMFGYAELTTAEPFLALEALKPFCTTLLLIAVMTFVKDNAPMTTMSTVEAIFGSAYFGVGRGLGGLFGGFSIEALGNVTTFRIFGGASVVTAMSYSAVMAIQMLRKTKTFKLNPV
jgi:MFS family permease